jgi:hypothetical protein
MMEPRRIPAAAARALVEVLDVFGNVDEQGKNWLLPDRNPDQVDIESLVVSLRQAFWPNEGEEDDGKASDQELAPVRPASEVRRSRD